MEVFQLTLDETNTQKSIRVTIRHVAEVAGVSTATVSHVINNTGCVTQATQQRVKAAIRNMKWKPNIHARNLARSTRLGTDDRPLLMQSYINPEESGSFSNFEEDLLLIENYVDDKANRHKAQ